MKDDDPFGWLFEDLVIEIANRRDGRGWTISIPVWVVVALSVILGTYLVVFLLT